MHVTDSTPAVSPPSDSASRSSARARRSRLGAGPGRWWWRLEACGRPRAQTEGTRWALALRPNQVLSTQRPATQLSVRMQWCRRWRVGRVRQRLRRWRLPGKDRKRRIVFTYSIKFQPCERVNVNSWLSQANRTSWSPSRLTFCQSKAVGPPSSLAE